MATKKRNPKAGTVAETAQPATVETYLATVESCIIPVTWPLPIHGPTYQAQPLTVNSLAEFITEKPLRIHSWQETAETAETAKQAQALAIKDKRKRDGKDAWQPATGGSDSLAKISATIIRRLNYPKAVRGKQSLYKRDTKLGKAGSATKAEREKSLTAKARKILSKQEEQDVFQTVALVLHAHGKLEMASGERITYALWKALFSACHMEVCIDRIREIAMDPASDEFTLQETISTGHNMETVALARQKLAKRISYWFACIKKDRDTSANRMRIYNYAKHRSTLRLIAGMALTFKSMTQAEFESASKAKERLIESVTRGEAEFDREAASACKRDRATPHPLALAMMRLD